MKVFGGPKGKVGTIRVAEKDYKDALRYALSLDGIASACLGIVDAEELRQALKVMEDFTPLTQEEFMELSMKGLSIVQKDESWRTVYGTPVA
jgi:predicted aldo/keto reductase-like oxidoreductase